MLAFFRKLPEVFVDLLRSGYFPGIPAHSRRYTALRRIGITVGDITKLKVHAIVNAANPTLLGGGGVDGAIHAAAGPRLLEYCRGLAGCAPGDAVLTFAYDLPAWFIIHAVGPDTREVRERAEQDRLLESAYRKAMELSQVFYSIAFPAISCGVYGFDPARAARIAIRTIAEGLEHATWQHVTLVAFDEAMAAILETELSRQRAEARRLRNK